MAGTRWRPVLRHCLAMVNRELRITLTSVPNPEKWVFVVGCYNSGTTLLAEILGRHSQISALPTEGQYLTDQLPSDHEIGLSRMWVEREDLYRLDENDPGPDANRLKREWAMRLNCKRPVFLEKTPANAARMRWLQKHFENSHFIAIIRNGYAVAEGITRKAKPVHRRPGWPLRMAAWQWYRSNEVMFEDAKTIKNFHWLKYEDLTRDPKTEVGKILNFLGLEQSEGLDFGCEWRIHERNEPISNMNSLSISRLSESDIRVIEEICAPLLNRMSYKPE